MTLDEIPAGANLRDYSVLIDAGAHDLGRGLEWARLVKLKRNGARFPVTVSGHRTYREHEVLDVCQGAPSDPALRTEVDR